MGWVKIGTDYNKKLICRVIKRHTKRNLVFKKIRNEDYKKKKLEINHFTARAFHAMKCDYALLKY